MEMEARRSAVTPRPQKPKGGAECDWLGRGAWLIAFWLYQWVTDSVCSLAELVRMELLKNGA